MDFFLKKANCIIKYLRLYDTGFKKLNQIKKVMSGYCSQVYFDLHWWSPLHLSEVCHLQLITDSHADLNTYCFI